MIQTTAIEQAKELAKTLQQIQDLYNKAKLHKPENMTPKQRHDFYQSTDMLVEQRKKQFLQLREMLQAGVTKDEYDEVMIILSRYMTNVESQSHISKGGKQT